MLNGGVAKKTDSEDHAFFESLVKLSSFMKAVNLTG
jgi:hypothetical protein